MNGSTREAPAATGAIRFHRTIIPTKEEIRERRRAELAKLKHWRYKRETTELVTEAGRYRYYVDLERCTTSAAVLDWIAQIAGKTWATAEVVGELVFALDILIGLQGTLCGWAISEQSMGKGPINMAEHLRGVAYD